MVAFLKQIIVISILAVAAVAGFIAYERNFRQAKEAGPAKSRQSAPAAVEISPAEKRTIARRIEAVGTTRAYRSIEIVALAEGRIREINIKPGEQVQAGDVLVRLDDDIEKADLAEAEAMLLERTSALNRAQALRDRNTVSAATLEQLVANTKAAEAGMDRARRRLADRTVRAPFAGVVGLTSLHLGARIDDNTVITTLDDLESLEIEFALPEVLYGQAQPGLKIVATSAAFPGREFGGTVVSLDSRVDPTARSFKVRARLPNPDHGLPSGMFMFLALQLAAVDVIVVSEEALVAEGARSYVFVVADAKAERRAVKTGQREVGFVEVTEGIEAGEMVVTRGLQRLRDGADVRVLEPGEPVSAVDKDKGDGSG